MSWGFSIQPISKEIVEEARKLNIAGIELQFEGGDDNGYLEVDFVGSTILQTADGIERKTVAHDDIKKFDAKVQEWAWDAYSYNGAGDGNRYGDTVYYDLERATVRHESWYDQTERVEDGVEEEELAYAEAEEV